MIATSLVAAQSSASNSPRVSSYLCSAYVCLCHVFVQASCVPLLRAKIAEEGGEEGARPSEAP